MNKKHTLTNEEYQAAFEYLMQGDHQVIVYGVLKRLHINKGHSNYDDMVQEGYLAFAEIYHKYPKEKRTRGHLNYIYQGMKWRLINRLNSITRHNNHFDDSDDEHDPLLTTMDPKTVDYDYSKIDFVHQLYKECDQNEQKYIQGIYRDNLTVPEMARKYNVARKTIYAWRKKVIKKAKKI